jgi:hypothetical protein
MDKKESIEENKQIVANAVKDKDRLTEFYNTHTGSETIAEFGIKSKKILYRILKEIGYDFSYKKTHCAMKGRKATRSHESYVNAGIISGKTQQNNWSTRSQEEKNAWSKKMKDSHSSKEYKKAMSEMSKKEIAEMSPEKKQEINNRRSASCKDWWNSLSEDKAKAEVAKHFAGGAGWNYSKIKKTLKEKYGVDNISQLDSVKAKSKETMIKTCQSTYGVNWNCQLPQCTKAIGAKSSNTKPNADFDTLLKKSIVEYKGIVGDDREFPIGRYIYDFRVNKILIEIDPTATHNILWGIHGKPRERDYHLKKSEEAKLGGYRCIHVFDWDDPKKVVQLLCDRETIYARLCDVKETSKQDARDFLNEYHLQGSARNSVRLGLYYNNELVSLMTFGTPRYNKNYEWELIRYCSSKNVVGGSERLFKHFVDTYKPKTVISYCDNSKFDGDTYVKLGFLLKSKGRPTVHWYNIKTKEHYTDNLIRNQGFSRVVMKHDASLDNFSTDDNVKLLIDHGFVPVCDCGQSVFVWNA